jgi:hypothetical protein
MSTNVIVCFVVVLAIIIAIVFLMMPSESYGYTGMSSATDRPVYPFWRGAEWPKPYEARAGFDWQRGEQPFRSSCNVPETVMSRAQQRQSLGGAYTIDENVKRDLYRDGADGLLDVGVNYGYAENIMQTNRNAQILASNTVDGVTLPSSKNCCGGVTPYSMMDSSFYNQRNLVPLGMLGASVPPGAVTNTAPVTMDRMRYGNGKFMEAAPSGTYRFGGYNHSYNVGNAMGNSAAYSDAAVGVL